MIVKKSILLSLALGVFLFSCQTNDNVTPSSTASAKNARTAATNLILNGDFSTPYGWQAYGPPNTIKTPILRNGNYVMSVHNRITKNSMGVYSKQDNFFQSVNCPTAGTYTITLALESTGSSIPNNEFIVNLDQNSTVPSLGLVPNTILAVPLPLYGQASTTFTASFNVPTAGYHTLYFRHKLVTIQSSGTTSAYVDNISVL
jgi:hypothetical protein